MTATRNAPIAPQTISTGRPASVRPKPPGRGRHSSRWSRGSGHRTASATNDTTSTIAAAQPKSHSGIGRSDRATRPCASGITNWSGWLNDQAADEGIPAGIFGYMALDLEDALDVRLE